MTRSSRSRIERRRAKARKESEPSQLTQPSASSRTPPADVRRELRREVGFGCPVPNCCNPFLEWHHFDPPWSIEHHHRPQGMVALCVLHHKQADGGAFTRDQLREFKNNATANPTVSARFNWLRNDMLIAAGGTLFQDVRVIFQYRDLPVIWLHRSESGHQLLNVRMLSTSHERRLWVENHDFILQGDPVDMECPPTGRILKVKYKNGDRVDVEFYDIASIDELTKHFPQTASVVSSGIQLTTPITVCEVGYAVGGTRIRFRPASMEMPGFTTRGGFMRRGNIAIQLN